MHWRSPHIQHDIAEFWGYMMNTYEHDVPDVFSGDWAEIEHIPLPDTDLPLAVLSSRNSLKQALLVPLAPDLAHCTLQNLHRSLAQKGSHATGLQCSYRADTFLLVSAA